MPRGYLPHTFVPDGPEAVLGTPHSNSPSCRPRSPDPHQLSPHHFLGIFPRGGKTYEGVGEGHRPLDFLPTRRFTKKDNLSIPKHAQPKSPLTNAEQILNQKYIHSTQALASGARKDTAGRGREAGVGGGGGAATPLGLGLQHLPHTDPSQPQEGGDSPFSTGS